MISRKGSPSSTDDRYGRSSGRGRGTTTTPLPPTPTEDGTDDGHLDAEVAAKVREHREDLRDLAETDLPAARWAQALLDLAEE